MPTEFTVRGDLLDNDDIFPMQNMVALTSTPTITGGNVNNSFGGSSNTTSASSLDNYTYCGHDLDISTVYNIEVYDSDGRLKWCDSFENLTTNEGLNKLLDATIKTGLASPAWFVALVDGNTLPAYSVADTMSSHPGWTEFTGYSDTTRVAYAPGAVSGGVVDNAASRAQFHINVPGTVAGCFLTDASTISGTTGTLFGVGSFMGGAKAVDTGDTLRCTSSISISQ